MEREDKKNMMPEEEYLKQMSALPKVKAPEDFLKKVHERIERRSAFEKIMRALFVPVKIKVPLEVAAMAAAVILIVSTIGIKKPSEQLAYAPKPDHAAKSEFAFNGFVNKPAADKKIVVAEADRRDAEAGRHDNEEVYANVSASLDLGDKLAAQAPAAESKPVEIALLVNAAKGNVFEERGLEEKAYEEKALEKEKSAPRTETALVRRPYLTEALSKVKNQVELAQGKVTNVEMNKDTGMPQYIDAEIPAAGYPAFIGKLAGIGVLQEPILKDAPAGLETIRVRIKLAVK